VSTSPELCIFDTFQLHLGATLVHGGPGREAECTTTYDHLPPAGKAEEGHVRIRLWIGPGYTDAPVLAHDNPEFYDGFTPKGKYRHDVAWPDQSDSQQCPTMRIPPRTIPR